MCSRLAGKHAMLKVVQAYETFRSTDNLLPATYEVIYGHAWGAIKSVAGETRIPISEIRRHK